MNESSNQAPYQIDRDWIRRSFDRAAKSYDAAAVLQREVANRLLERLELIKLEPAHVLDIGSGTGFGANALRTRYKKANVTSVDFAEGMLNYARSHAPRLDRWRGKQKYVCADAAALPFADNSVDLVFSSLALQWCDNLDAVFQEFQRVVRPEGLIMFATLGPDTLKELRASWAAVDQHTHVSPFLDMHDIGDALVRARLADPVMDVEHLVLTYGTVRELMKDLKSIGSRNATNTRAHSLTGKQRLTAMQNHYESFRKDGVLPATYEIAYGHAWSTDAPAVSDKPGLDFPIPVRVER